MVRLALVNFVAFLFVTASAEEPANYRHERQSNPNIVGVASIAKVTSRNGRISSTGGIHFYPGPGAAGYTPTIYTKAIGGNYATGNVQIVPGALGISSAQAGDDPFWPMDWQRHWPQWPIPTQYVFEDPRTESVNLPQARVRQQWVYPNFNPFFNLWR